MTLKNVHNVFILKTSQNNRIWFTYTYLQEKEGWKDTLKVYKYQFSTISCI